MDNEIQQYVFYLNKQAKSKKTIETYKTCLRMFLRSGFAFNDQSVMLYFNKNNHFSSSTRNNMVKALKHYGDMQGIDFMRSWKMKKTQRGQIYLLTVEEQKKFVKAAYKISFRYGLIMETFVCTGLRLVELQRITVGDCMQDRIYIHGKGTKERYVFLPKRLQNKLNKRIDQILAEKRKHLYVFGDQGMPNKESIYKARTEALRLAGINKHVKIHHLRHTYATTQKKAGVDLDTIRDVLGHTNLEITQLYIHTDDEDRARAARIHPLSQNRTREDFLDRLQQLQREFEGTPYAKKIGSLM